ncbi:Shedu immune nuclease family protein [Roseomonas mucosa]|uniref:Shedu immune nuclease family protein n=1 Tax=Roseomonas mucosa TaxID=207340 RepID=UPI0026863630|nr:Shedu immune nuclease family protein [Roseomonas mucosa]QDD97046.1 hypothetical protein ADP8_05200 [Roseomonas mucosa]
MTESRPKLLPPFPVRAFAPDPERKPDIEQVNTLLLHGGPLARKEVVHFAVRDRNTGVSKGNRIGFRTNRKSQGQWQREPAKCFTLDSDEQIGRALHFMLAACRGSIPGATGEFVVVPVAGADTDALQRVVNALSREGRADLLAELLAQASRAPDLLDALMRQAERNPRLFVEAAATLNLARYRAALAELDRLVASSNREQDFQQLLTAHPWMFGSEYSQHLAGSRGLTRGTQQDFVLRRTTDGYIEVVEIKTPLGGRDLFRADPSHQSHFAGAELSAAVGQVQKYIEELDAGRYEIKARDGEDTNKVRAKIIIGRDGDEAQCRALRRFNGHLHRIEILTFDHLRRVAHRVVSYLETLVPRSRGEVKESEEPPL